LQTIYNRLGAADQGTLTGLDIADVVSITRTYPTGTPASVTKEYSIENIRHVISSSSHTVEFGLAVADLVDPFIVGGYTTTTTRTNLVTNPSVEVSTSGWASGGTLTQSSTFAYSGTYSARAEITSAVTTDTNAGNLAGIIAGQTYTFSVYVRSSIARSFRVYISWLNGASFISNTIGTTSTTSTTGFTRFTVTGVAPATANGARPTMQVLSPSISDLIYLDGLLFENAASALPYFDGTYADPYTDYTIESQVWNGTADASTSTAIWGLTSTVFGTPMDSNFALS
jgi:hypothetical protein